MEQVKISKNALQLAKSIAHRVWDKYDDTHGYRTEKQEKNFSVSVEEPYNLYFFYGQFDTKNQAEFRKYLQEVKENEELIKQDTKSTDELISHINNIEKEKNDILNNIKEDVKSV